MQPGGGVLLDDEAQACRFRGRLLAARLGGPLEVAIGAIGGERWIGPAYT
jgi:hypothetical protein